MRIAILDPFSGIAGDMMLGALVDLGLDHEWLRALPRTLGLDGVTVRVERAVRAGISAQKVDFDIPPQPHGRHLSAIRKIVAGAGLPDVVRERADQAFTAIATVEAEIHGTTVDKVHLHEVGAVDAILDVVGSIWGMHRLGVDRVYCTTVALGDGTVKAAHGMLAVPVPATLRLLEGVRVRPGPEHSGELVTPTGAALIRVLSSGAPPDEYVPERSGYGAGTKEFPDRANVLRIILADAVASAGADGAIHERLIMLSCDIDDMSPEYLAAAVERLRASGARDVLVLPVAMKKGRAGSRLEVLATPSDADALERAILTETTTIGVRRWPVDRRALPREMVTVRVEGRPVRVKVVTLPDGGRRAKAESDDVRAVALASGRPDADISRAAVDQAERLATDSGSRQRG